MEIPDFVLHARSHKWIRCGILVIEEIFDSDFLVLELVRALLVIVLFRISEQNRVSVHSKDILFRELRRGLSRGLSSCTPPKEIIQAGCESLHKRFCIILDLEKCAKALNTLCLCLDKLLLIHRECIEVRFAVRDFQTTEVMKVDI
jgi:hypothetical protein